MPTDSDACLAHVNKETMSTDNMVTAEGGSPCASEIFLGSELEIAAGSGAAMDIVRAGRGQQAFHTTQVFPRRLIKGGIGANEVTNHLPGGDVQRAFWWRPHSQ